MNDRTLLPEGASHELCATSLQYLGALDEAAELETALGDPHVAAQDAATATALRAALYHRCWDEHRGLLADNPEKTSFSQQTNMLGVLFGVVPPGAQKAVLQQVLALQPGQDDPRMTSASYYFRFYLARALLRAGMGEQYLDSLKPWRDLLPLHFSTWPEVPGDTRSDSHAWSAHPIYDLLTAVAGVEPAAPGFAGVRVAPHLGALRHVSADYPHPRGNIHLEYTLSAGKLTCSITLPPGVPATFSWQGTERPLQSGSNRFSLPATLQVTAAHLSRIH